ncbi:hypothetical protein D3C77_335210 [compost metagenome]
MMRCVASVVWVTPQAICGVAILSVRKLKGTGWSSAACISSRSQAMVRPSSRAGVPVFSRPIINSAACRSPARPLEGSSP